MAAVTGTLGGQPVVLDNAATEETLKKVLAALQGQMKASAGATAGKTASPGAGAGSGLGNLGKEVGSTSKAFGTLGKVAGMAGGGIGFIFKALSGVLGGFLSVVSTLAGAAFEAANAMIGLAKQAFDGDVRMSDFFGAFKNLPIIGVVAGLFAELAKIQEANLDAFRRMAKTGIGFEGDLNKVRQGALDMGVSLEQFTGVMKNSQDIFKGLGGDAESGAQAFVKFTGTLRNSSAGKDLRALGMTAEESANAMANYIRNNGGLSEAQKKDYNGVAQSVAEYSKQTDRLAKLTGTSAEEIEKKMAKEAQEAAFQAHLQTLEPKEREAAMAAMKVALATGGQGAVDALKARMLGLPPMTEAGQKFESMSARASKRLGEMEAVTKSNMSADQKKQKLEELGAMLQLDRAKDADEIGIQTLQALALQGDQNAIAMLTASTDMKKAGVTTYEGAVANLKKAGEAQEKQLKSTASMAAEAENSLKNIGQSFQAFIAPLLTTLQPLMTNMIQSFSEFVSGPNGKAALKSFGEYLAKLIKEMADYMKNLFSPEGREKIMNDIKNLFKFLWLDVKKALIQSIPGGSLLYSDKDYADDKKAIEAESELYDARAKAATANAQVENDARAAKIALEKDGVSKTEKAISDRTAKMKELDDKMSKETNDIEKAKLAQQKADLETQQKIDQDALNKAKTLDKTKADAIVAEYDKNKKIMADTAAKIDELKNPKSTNYNVTEDGTYVGAMADGGDIPKGKYATVGEAGPEFVKGPASVTSAKDTKDMIVGQNTLIQAIQTLNIQTEKLIALNVEQAKHQHALVQKMQWTGNLFE